jgi:hypothetical protein
MQGGFLNEDLPFFVIKALTLEKILIKSMISSFKCLQYEIYALHFI